VDHIRLRISPFGSLQSRLEHDHAERNVRRPKDALFARRVEDVLFARRVEDALLARSV
jgi:hypothetical protein